MNGTMLLAIVTDVPNALKKAADELGGIFGRLREEIQNLVGKFSTNTRTSFLADLEADASFFDFVNNADNLLTVKGFLAHKAGVLTDLEKEQLAEMIAKGEIAHPKAEEWLNRSENIEKFQGNITKGNIFEGNMATKLADEASEAYQGLKRIVSDLDDRTILKQVQFCIRNTPDCNGKGDYFIADFVAVVEKVDGEEVIFVINKSSGAFRGLYKVSYLTNPPPSPCTQVAKIERSNKKLFTECEEGYLDHTGIYEVDFDKIITLAPNVATIDVSKLEGLS